MLQPPLVVSLPIADRRTSFAFYRDALELEPVGAPAEDGVPEPLQFALGAGARLMLVPRGGFDWVTGEHHVAPPGTSECLLSLTAADEPEVDRLVARATAAGAKVVIAPEAQRWGYAGTFADPDGHLWMVIAGLPPS